MLRAYICGHKPKMDAYGHAACGVNHLEIRFCFTGQSESTKRSDRT